MGAQMDDLVRRLIRAIHLSEKCGYTMTARALRDILESELSRDEIDECEHHTDNSSVRLTSR